MYKAKVIAILIHKSGRFSDKTGGGQIIEENMDCNNVLSFICQETGMYKTSGLIYVVLRNIGAIPSCIRVCLFLYFK
jgi:hypothetical protein